MLQKVNREQRKVIFRSEHAHLLVFHPRDAAPAAVVLSPLAFLKLQFFLHAGDTWTIG